MTAGEIFLKWFDKARMEKTTTLYLNYCLEFLTCVIFNSLNYPLSWNVLMDPD